VDLARLLPRTPLLPLVLVALGAAGCADTPTPLPATDAGAADAATSPDASSGGGDAGTACGATAALVGPGLARTTTGLAEGVEVTAPGGPVWAWRGLPYAAPPLGALRWRPPEAPACWADTRRFERFGPKCPQLTEDGAYEGDEDCLTLNVWAPAGGAARPVWVFLHGGGNTVGAASEPLYDGALAAAEQGLVVITVQYRLGALGFFSHPALDAERAERVSGNYGLLDQQAALRWVRDNVAAFGGDPAKVLLFGESAGAQDTLAHFVSPGAAGLARAMLVQSGGYYSQTLAEGHAAMTAVVDAVGCSAGAEPLPCLRGTSAEALVRVPAAIGPLELGLKYRPVIDGVVIPDDPERLLREGRGQPIPLVVGSNADETSRMVPAVRTEAEYREYVTARFAGLAPQVLAQYPASAFATPRQALVRLTTDVVWTCPTRRILRWVEAAGRAPTYRYFFDARGPGAAGQIVGATHGFELAFVFGNFSVLQGFMPDAGLAALGRQMRDHWASLAATGTPAPTAAVAWPAYVGADDAALRLAQPIEVLRGVRTEGCDFWDGLGL
jgi:para-nitrobenzyl esterase